MMSEENGFSVTTFCGGDIGMFDHVGIPLAEALNIFPQESRERLNLAGKNIFVRNNAETVLWYGFAIFVAGHLTKKILDDVYTVSIQPRIKPVLEKVEARFKEKRPPKKIFNWSLWYGEYQVWVSVSMVSEFDADSESQLNAMKDVHRTALEWINANGVKGTVHHYRIEKGFANVAPIIADHLSEVIR
jgi:hypothetical protein